MTIYVYCTITLRKIANLLTRQSNHKDIVLADDCNKIPDITTRKMSKVSVNIFDTNVPIEGTQISKI